MVIGLPKWPNVGRHNYGASVGVITIDPPFWPYGKGAVLKGGNRGEEGRVVDIKDKRGELISSIYYKYIYILYLQRLCF